MDPSLLHQMHQVLGDVEPIVLLYGFSINGLLVYKIITLQSKLTAAAIWGAEWTNKSILCYDNEAVVHVIQAQAKTP